MACPELRKAIGLMAQQQLETYGQVTFRRKRDGSVVLVDPRTVYFR